MINYTWNLNGVDFSISGTDAHIQTIHWGCVAIDSDDPEELFASAVGSISVADENWVFPVSTVKNTTKTQVMQWLNDKLGDEKQKIKDNLAGEIGAKSVMDSFIPVD